MQRERCSAKSKSTGERCRRYAIPGGKTCRSHGSAAPQVRAAAAQRVAEERVRQAAARYVPDAAAVEEPLTALLKLAGEITSFKDFLAGRIGELDAEVWRYRGEAAEQLRAEIGLYERALDRTARVLVDVNRLGLEARVTALYEQLAAGLLQVLDQVLVDLGVGDEVRLRAPVVWGARVQEAIGGGPS